MRSTFKRLATLSALAALTVGAPRLAVAEDYELQGRWYGGADVGVMQPLNALDRYVTTGGALSPYVGYKFFDDKDLQLNLGLEGALQFIGGGADACSGCVRGQNDEDMFAIGYLAGPRLSLPVGPMEMYGKFLGGGMSGVGSSPSAISDTSGGFLAGGGLNYNINDNIGLGLFANWNRQYQRVHGVGDVRFVTTGVELNVQQSPPAPPAPVAQVPPPPPPPAPMKKKLVLRGVNFDFDKYFIRPVDEPVLEEACKILKAEPGIDVSCQGHTDLVGSAEYNQRLSERRANVVRDWFINKCGIPASRLTAEGFGESNPVEDTTGPSLQNRRTELIVTNQ